VPQIDESWLITSEHDSLQEILGEQFLFRLTVVAVQTPPLLDLVGQHPWYGVDRPSVAWISGHEAKFHEAYEEITTYAAVLGDRFEMDDARAARDAIERVLLEARVPAFGSPPSSWETVETLIGNGVLATGAIIDQPLLAVLSGVGITLFLKVALPAAGGLGAALDYRIRKALGLPDELLNPRATPQQDNGDEAAP
jgi:hypothetical protein